LRQGQAGDVESDGADVIAVYAIFIGIQLGLGLETEKGEEAEE